MSFFRRLFGSGKVRYELVCIDKRGKTKNLTVKVPYEGEWDETEMTNQIIDMVRYETGLIVIKTNLISHIKD